jgi:hypothetical protein
MTSLEDTLAAWTAPSSPTEQEQQERTERMIREAVAAHDAFEGCSLSVYAKGSYANNTNVRTDSDVDISVQCHEAEYWDAAVPGIYTPANSYSGIWTPTKLRSELKAALDAKFPSQVDGTGSTAFRVHSTSSRVDADVVPCFDYRYHFAGGGSRAGTKIFKTSGKDLLNWPVQHLENGRSKNTSTRTVFKKAVRILKRTENAMVEANVSSALASYLIECLVYNCPNPIFERSTWTEVIRGILVHVWEGLEAAEPLEESERWLEVNRCKFLFSSAQDWTRPDSREFARAAWNYMGFAS